MTRTIHLDPSFRPLVYPEIEFELLKFPGGELHPKLNPRISYPNIEKVVITQRANNSDAIMSILVVADALKRAGVKSLDLVMPYIPYARQDRYNRHDNLGESFALDLFASLINSVGFEKVYVFDAHSDVSTALIKNVENIDNAYYVYQSLKNLRHKIIESETNTLSFIDESPIWLISPDSGANKKINKLWSSLIHDYDAEYIKGIVKCDKIRDIHTGKLSGFEVFNKNLEGLDCLIVDDICDGGGTFNGLAKELKINNAGNLYLYITHGIFSQGFEQLLKNFKKIYTTDSIKDIDVPNVKRFKIEL